MARTKYTARTEYKARKNNLARNCVYVKAGRGGKSVYSRKTKVPTKTITFKNKNGTVQKITQRYQNVGLLTRPERAKRHTYKPKGRKRKRRGQKGAGFFYDLWGGIKEGVGVVGDIAEKVAPVAGMFV